MIGILTKKQYELLNLLAQSKEVISSEQISDRLGLSTKTVHRYIELINKYLTDYDLEILSMRGYGFILQGNIKLVENLAIDLSSGNYDRRIKDMVLYLLSKEYITIEEMSNMISYSASTLNKLIPEVKKYLAVHNLKLLSKPYSGIYIVGSELNKRNIMIECAFIKNHYGEITCLMQNIQEGEFSLIREVIVGYLHERSIIIADDDVSDLIMRTAIIISRCRQNCLLDDLDYTYEENIIQTMLELVSEKLHIVVPMSEASYLSMYFDIINSRLNDSPSIIQEDINKFVSEAIMDMQKKYSNLVIQDTVQKSLILHLSLMLNRINHKHYIKNALLQDIKANYTLEMNYAITFGKMIEDHFHIKVTEDELGYLALYFALSNNKQKKVKRVIILCNYGIATSQLIREQIKEKFPELEIVGIYPLYYLEVVMNQDIDMIISTVSLGQSKVTKPLIVIKQFLDEDALNEIKRVIDNPDTDALSNYFDPKAFFVLEATSKQAALDELSDKMTALGFFTKETIEKIYERETISSTDIGNLVAIPHAIIDNSQKSAIGIGILKKPITWDTEKVQVIFMAGLNTKDAQKNNIFRHLYRIIKDVSNVNHLIESKSFKTFKKLY